MHPAWIEALETKAPAFVNAARAFLRHGNADQLASGPDAIQWLVGRLEMFVNADENDDQIQDADVFVEGAGAFLGLVLIDHFGGAYRRREHNHRVQIGKHGFFDPFGAIGVSLDADNPRTALADCLRVAESEARDDGPVSKTVSAFAKALGELRPDIQITDQFELDVSLSDETVVNLERVAHVVDAEDEALHGAARRMVSLLPGSETPAIVSWADAKERLFPRIVPGSFLQKLPKPSALFAQPFEDKLHIALQLRYEGRSRYVRADEVNGWIHKTPGAHPLAQAVDNLSQASEPLRLEPCDIGAVTGVRVRHGDGLDSSRLLLPTLFSGLARQLSMPILAVAPHRDALVACSGTTSSLRAIAEFALSQADSAPHPVSTNVFEVTRQGLRPHRLETK